MYVDLTHQLDGATTPPWVVNYWATFSTKAILRYLNE